jgi:hypothetical protein
MIAGAVGNDFGFAKLNSLRDARAKGHLGSRAVGASFHKRRYALASDVYSLLDLNLVRYNTAHPGARTDLFPCFISHVQFQEHDVSSSRAACP